jgi:dolichol kinase
MTEVMVAGQGVAHHVSFRNELLRKSIHLCSLSIPIACAYWSRETMLTLLLPLTIVTIAVDLLRSFSRPVFDLYQTIFGTILRRHEQTPGKVTLNGASWVFLSALVCILIFPTLITITAFAILIISDTVAAIIGRRYGTKKYRDKTIQGSTAFVISACIVVLCTPKVAYHWTEYLIAAVSTIFGALAEVFSFDVIDDNFSIPIAIGLTLWAMYAIFLPGFNVHILGN